MTPCTTRPRKRSSQSQVTRPPTHPPTHPPVLSSTSFKPPTHPPTHLPSTNSRAQRLPAGTTPAPGLQRSEVLGEQQGPLPARGPRVRPPQGTGTTSHLPTFSPTFLFPSSIPSSLNCTAPSSSPPNPPTHPPTQTPKTARRLRGQEQQERLPSFPHSHHSPSPRRPQRGGGTTRRGPARRNAPPL